MSAVDQHAASEPARRSPDHGDASACGCGGAWHEAQDHCVSWPCPGCTRLCPAEPGVPIDEDEPDIAAWGTS
ncbi:hypothetical protein ACH3XX_00545 [Streptomyces scabiei]|uniref:hypothetical protein n=1 Tax=Streptomyces scabiei TaxID=1930 RepID=UPI00379E4CC7